jgi:DNA-binding transcriptional MerR regulator
MDLESFATAAGLHPDVVRRLVGLGLLDAERDAGGELWFSPAQLTLAGRIQRLRAGFGINYAGLGLVIDLIDRVARLEAALRHLRRMEASHSRQFGDRRWT